jgi:chromosomal replication initiator protein
MNTCTNPQLTPDALHLLNPRLVSADIEHEILREVCRICDVFLFDVKARTKGRQGICDARHIAVTLIEKYTIITYARIGVLLGGRDRSTITHSLRVARYFSETDKIFKRKLAECEQAVKLKFFL